MRRRIEAGDRVIDNDGVVHRVRWAHGDGAEDFTVYCRAQMFLVYGAFFAPTDQNTSCLRCLGEAG